MKLSRLASLILLGGFLTLMVIAPQVATVEALELEYFPLAPGNAVVYNSTNDDGTWMTKRYVAEEYEFLGGPYGTFTILWSEAHMLPEETDYSWVNHMWIGKTSDTLTWWGFEDQAAKAIASSPLNYVTEPVVAGAVHRGATTVTLTIKETGMVLQEPFSANYTIEAIEDVTVPAGTFEDCIKIHEEEITPDGDVSFWVWYAPNVGAVQYYYPQQNDRWDKATEYTIDLENDPWDDWLLPQVPTLLLIVTIAIVAVVVLVVAFKFMKRGKA